MLQSIRDNASGPLAYAVVGLISLVFGVWGIGSYFTPSANPVVASVGDVKITRYQLQQKYNQGYQRLRQRMGERFNSDTFEPQQLRRSILQDLVRSAVLDQYALNAGYRTTDQALLRVLKSNPQFQVDGEFSTQRYNALLANAGLTPSTYEARLRRQIVTNQVRAGLVQSAFVAPPALHHAYSRLKQKRKLAYLLFPADAYTEQVQVTQEEIQAWYDSHGQKYMRPGRVKLAYVELDRSSLNAQQAVTEDKLKSLYQQHKRQFSTPDKRDGLQVFIPVTQDSAAQVRQTIQTLAQKLRKGQSLETVVSDAAGNVKVTHLEDVARRQLPADVSQALFTTKVGKMSTPVRGDKGWYLIKPTAKKPGKVQPISSAEVQKQLKQMAQSQWRNKRFSELSERMETLAFQAPNSLDTLSSELDLKIQHTDWITRNQGKNLGQFKAVRQAAFSDAVLNKKLNSTAIQLDKNHRVVLRVAAHQASQKRPLDEVRSQVKTHLVANKAQKLARQAAQRAKQKLSEDGGTTMQAVSEQTPAQLNKAGYIGRTARQVPASVRQAVFALPEPSNGQSVYKVAATGGDGVALVALKDVKKDVLSDDKNIPKLFKRRRRVYTAQLEYAAFADYLNRHAEVELHEEQLDFN